PRAVGELAGELPVSRPAVSPHLKVLKDADLVFERPAGTRRIYQLDPDGLAALRAELDRFWVKALAAYQEVVEQDDEGENPWARRQQRQPCWSRSSSRRRSSERSGSSPRTSTRSSRASTTCSASTSPRRCSSAAWAA